MYEYNINDAAINDQVVPLRELSQEESVYGNLKDSDWRALIAIAKSPEGMGTKELAQAAQFSRQYATEVGNRLVKLGYVNVKKLPTKPKETSIYFLSSHFNREKIVAVGEAVIQRQQPRILSAKDASQIRDFEELQSILAQESTLTRLIYRCLEKNKGKNVKELEEELGKSGSFINVHLTKLLELGLVIRKKESKAFVYFLEKHDIYPASIERV